MTTGRRDGEPLILFEGVHVAFGETVALDLPALEIGRGEKVFVPGPSGSGKTTLLRLVKGRLCPTRGSVKVCGESPSGRERRVRSRVAMIDQEFLLVPRLSVIGNVLSGCLGRMGTARSLIGWYPAPEWARAGAILEEVGLQGLGHRRVETLSGGQRQRAAIARALMQEAEVLLADEPTSSLDPELAEDVLQLLVDCVERRGMTLLVNSHQPELVRRYASRFMGLSQGRRVYDGPPEGFTRTQGDRVYRASPADSSEEKGSDHGDEPAPALEAPAADPNLRLAAG